jgi:hypothetical protein
MYRYGSPPPEEAFMTASRLLAAACGALFSLSSLSASVGVAAGLVGSSHAATVTAVASMGPRLLANPVIVVDDYAIRAVASIDARLLGCPVIVLDSY